MYDIFAQAGPGMFMFHVAIFKVLEKAHRSFPYLFHVGTSQYWSKIYIDNCHKMLKPRQKALWKIAIKKYEAIQKGEVLSFLCLPA